MKKILVLNLTRMGDLIQTTPLLAGLKEADPRCDITLAVNSGFVSITENMPFYDHKKVMNIEQFNALQGADVGISVLDLYKYLDGFIKDLREGGYDTVLNLTHSHVSGVIGKMIGIKDTRGVCYTDEGFRAIHNKWLIYFSILLSFRHLNSFNLVDIYQLSGEVRPKARKLLIDLEKPEREGRAFLKELGIGEGERIIGIQAGSSLSQRRWPPLNFARTADMLAEKWNAKVVFFGIQSERALVDDVISKMKGKAINLAGKTNHQQLIGVVKDLLVLITNDTATMHIAAAAGTPIVAIFLVHAYGAETGPYCKDAIILEPDIPCFPCGHASKCPHFACLAYILPKQAVEAADLAISLKEGKKPDIDPETFRNVRASRSFFDPYGFCDLAPVLKRPLAEDDILCRMYRHVFISPEVKEMPVGYIKDFLEANFVLWPPEEISAWADKKDAVFAKMARFGKDGVETVKKALSDYKSGDMKGMKGYGDGLARIDMEMEIHGLAHPELTPILKMFLVGRGNMSDAPVTAMLERAKMLYTEVRQSSEAMRALLEWFRGAMVPVEGR